MQGKIKETAKEQCGSTAGSEAKAERTGWLAGAGEKQFSQVSLLIFCDAGFLH